METARNLVGRLRDSGFSAYFVGGCVRDLLLLKNPKDFDIATNARPEQVSALFPQAKLVGAHFGVVLVDGVEIATYRSEASYSDGRRPDEIRFEDVPERDVERRDFTINGLLLDPASNEVLDFVGGRRDVEAGVIRAIGDPVQRFQEDHLRMLRAVRFAARLNFEIEPATEAAIRSEAKSIHRISSERIREELHRILTEGHARRGFELLQRSGLLAEILPEVLAMDGVPQPPEFHPEGDVWTHVRLMLEELDRLPAECRTISLAWGVLLHDIAKPTTITFEDRIRFSGHAEQGAVVAQRILSRLRCSQELMDQVTFLVAQHMKFSDVTRMKPSTLKRFVRQQGFEELLELHRIDCLSSARRLENYHFVREFQAHTPPELLKPAPLIDGRWLAAKGIRPGPEMGRLLRLVEEAQLNGEISSVEEAAQLVAREAGN